MGAFFYNIFIMPLQLLVEAVFDFFYSVTENPGLAIIGVSLVVNFLSLPLYRRADVLQKEQRQKELALSPWVTHIRKTFRGDERVMMLSAYYRENSYHPMMALRSSVSLLLQIPFFTAAYRFLSHLGLLSGASFWFLKDLGSPDALISFGEVHINLLPLLMTAVNLISSAVYTKQLSLSQKLQPVVLAALFLVLLYQAPSGLVFYWTCNNLFSLGKNLVFALPAFAGRTQEKEKRRKHRIAGRVYFLSGVFLTVLTGIVIPAACISSAPQDFADIHHYVDPNLKLFLTGSLAAGCFLFWAGVIYMLLPDKRKEGAARLYFILAVTALINHLFFAAPFGTLSKAMVYEEAVSYTKEQILLNLLALLLIAMILVLVYRPIKKAVPAVLTMLTVAVGVLGCVNIVGTERDLTAQGYEKTDEKLPEQLFSLDKKGKNVVVVMLDRAISSFVPYMFAEKPELSEAFTGFTWYPNTLSYGGHTNFAAPALYGGYDYTPEKINARASETLGEKHDEALLVMPRLFASENYEVTVLDPPYAGYREHPDLSIYDEVPQTAAYLTCGAYETEESEEIRKIQDRSLERRLFSFSVFRIAPELLRGFVYDDGTYHDLTPAQTIDSVLVNYYPVLAALPSFTEFSDTGKNTLLLMQNGTPHGPSHLSLPDYTLSATPDASGMDTGSRTSLAGEVLDTTNDRLERHYEVNMAAMLQLAAWLNRLKQEGVYDNTRIIIVSDHGYDLGLMPTITTGDKTYDTTFLNPLLLVKDFDADGELIVSEEFMTNADVPTIAAAGVINDPVNPFSGTPLDAAEKNGPQTVTTSKRFWLREANRFNTGDGYWVSVDHDIFLPESWKPIKEGEE